MPSENSDSKRTMTQLSIVVGVAILLAAAIVTAVVVANQPKNTAKTYQQCVDAGGVIMETYPEQCRVGDKTFTNEAQVPDAADGEKSRQCSKGCATRRRAFGCNDGLFARSSKPLCRK